MHKTLFVQEKGLQDLKETYMVVVLADLGRGWWFVQIWCWFVGFAIIYGYKKKREKNNVCKKRLFKNGKRLMKRLKKWTMRIIFSLSSQESRKDKRGQMHILINKKLNGVLALINFCARILKADRACFWLTCGWIIVLTCISLF